jgi:hypothetical protein
VSGSDAFTHHSTTTSSSSGTEGKAVGTKTKPGPPISSEDIYCNNKGTQEGTQDIYWDNKGRRDQERESMRIAQKATSYLGRWWWSGCKRVQSKPDHYHAFLPVTGLFCCFSASSPSICKKPLLLHGILVCWRSSDISAQVQTINNTFQTRYTLDITIPSKNVTFGQETEK